MTQRTLGEEAVSDRVWVANVEVDGVPGLGGRVRVEMTPRCTVLVGWNGAGKSLLLEGIAAACLEATAPFHLGESSPQVFACELRRGEQAFLKYEYTRSYSHEPRRGRQVSTAEIEERCWSAEPTGPRLLWELKSGNLVVPDAQGSNTPARRPEMAARALDDALSSVAVRAGIPREARDGRDEILMRASRRSPRSIDFSPDTGDRGTRLRELALQIIRLHEDQHDAFQHLVVMSRRVSLLRDLRVEFFPVPRHGKGEAFPDLAAVQVDGQNLGVLSDGTLRALETLVAVLTLPGTMILLEEPETGLHPGLLARLLNEVEAYATTGQVLITTHSMQVVSWARPDEIRLVERADDRTTVRALRPTELERLPDYLAHDGTLGEFVFGGGLDE